MIGDGCWYDCAFSTGGADFINGETTITNRRKSALPICAANGATGEIKVKKSKKSTLPVFKAKRQILFKVVEQVAFKKILSYGKIRRMVDFSKKSSI